MFKDADYNPPMYNYYRRQLLNGKLRRNFNRWNLTKGFGWTIAHEAASQNLLPHEFDHWYMRDSYGTTVAHIAAEHKNLPSNFGSWELTDGNGKTVREMYEYYKEPSGIVHQHQSIPIDIRWTRKKRIDSRVAPTYRHIDLTYKIPKKDLYKSQTLNTYEEWKTLKRSVKEKTFPEDFNQWSICNSNGKTLAHVYVKYHRLPRSLKETLTLKDNNGWTVAHEAAKYGHLPKYFNQWELEDGYGWTVAHVAALHNKLPITFKYWLISDWGGWTVAHTAAQVSRLSKTIYKLTKDYTDHNGIKVSDVVTQFNAGLLNKFKRVRV